MTIMTVITGMTVTNRDDDYDRNNRDEDDDHDGINLRDTVNKDDRGDDDLN